MEVRLGRIYGTGSQIYNEICNDIVALATCVVMRFWILMIVLSLCIECLVLLYVILLICICVCNP